MLVRAHALLIAAALCAGCAGRVAPLSVQDDRLPAHALVDAAARPSLALNSAPARALLDLFEGRAALDELPDVVLEPIAHAAGASTSAVRDALAGTAPIERFDFAAVRARPDAARRAMATAEEVFRSRSDAIAARVARLLPVGAGDPALPVVLVLGAAFDLRPVAGNGGTRLLVVDPQRLAARFPDADALGEHAARIAARELFLAAVPEQDSPLLRETGLRRDLAVLLVEGVGAFLAMDPRDRFDDWGRREALSDARAREAITRFERNVRRMLDPATPPADVDRLRWTMWNPAKDPDGGADVAPWGTHAVALMVDAIERFAPVGRLRDVLAGGPRDLFAAYLEVCGRHVAAPALDHEIVTLLRPFDDARVW